MERTSRARPIRSACAESRWRSAPTTSATSGDIVSRKPWRRSSTSSIASCCGPHPLPASMLRASSDRRASSSAIPSMTSMKAGRRSVDSPDAATWSSALRASRADPRPLRTAMLRASSSRSRWASSRTSRRSCSMVAAPSRRNSRCWVRLLMVAGTFCGSVVARMYTTCDGGSSSVLSSALAAAFDSMWTSSMMYTLCRPGDPRAAWPMRSRIASTPLLEAASSSMTSIEVPRVISMQLEQTPQGSPSTRCSQLSAFAKILADDVLPVPRGPLKRYAWATCSSITAVRRARTT